jgi:type IV fimbrial biogenesis protein FimT
MKHPKTISAIASSGFTIIELMLTISVLAVLLAIGVPAFNEVVRNNRTAAQTNEFVGALSLARSEATKRGMPVAVCAANAAQSACDAANAATWANGWLVFTDLTGTVGAFDGTDELLQRSRPITAGITLSSNNIGFMRYAPSGLPTQAVDIAFSVIHDQCSGINRRNVTIERTGRLNTAKVSCT